MDINEHEILTKIKKNIIAYSVTNNISLAEIHYVTPLSCNDRLIAVWLFYKKNEDIENYLFDGTSNALKNLIINYCSQFGLLKKYEFDFTFDSKENVDENYSGSYFYRLR